MFSTSLILTAILLVFLMKTVKEYEGEEVLNDIHT
jgi:hypothetical protein